MDELGFDKMGMSEVEKIYMRKSPTLGKVHKYVDPFAGFGTYRDSYESSPEYAVTFNLGHVYREPGDVKITLDYHKGELISMPPVHLDFELLNSIGGTYYDLVHTLNMDTTFEEVESHVDYKPILDPKLIRDPDDFILPTSRPMHITMKLSRRFTFDLSDLEGLEFDCIIPWLSSSAGGAYFKPVALEVPAPESPAEMVEVPKVFVVSKMQLTVYVNLTVSFDVHPGSVEMVSRG